MKKILFFLLLISSFSFLKAQSLDKKLIKSNLEFLASDELEGREAAKRGAKIASLYIATELNKYSVKPFGDNGTYFQNFILSSIKIDESSSIKVADKNLKIKEDFTLFFNSLEEIDTTFKCVFVGYGITAPEYEYDDYSDLNVENKSVLIMLGEPYSENEEFFNGGKKTKYSEFRYKIKNAIDKGAGQIILLMESESEEQRYWNYLSHSVDSEHLVKSESDEKKAPVIVLSYKGLKKVLTNEDLTYAEFQETREDNEIPETFEFKNEFLISVKAVSTDKKLRNVVGVVEGTDEKLKKEYIALTAHFDHVGFNNPDEVFNGADDNGSGTVGVIEVARIIAQKPLKRSVVFGFFTAEEKGLIGSDIFVEKHTSINSTVANVNLDMIAKGSTDTLYSIGEEKIESQISSALQSADDIIENFDIDQSENNNRLFYQSDHFNFFKKGIPCVFLNDMDFKDLHKVSDETKKINWEKLYKSIEFTSEVIKHLGNFEGAIKK